MFAFRNQPLKGLYFVYSGLSILFLRLPYWVVVSALPSWRPRPKWPFARAVVVRAVNAVMDIFFATAATEILYPETDAKSADQLGFVWIDPISNNLVRGEVEEMARTNGVVPVRTNGYWYGKKEGKHGLPAVAGEKVLFYLHGGGYMRGSGSPKAATAPITNALLEQCPTMFQRALAMDYRLTASHPFPNQNPFPAALFDALAGFQYLVGALGFQPENIIVCGDSAGGHLAVVLSRYLAVNSLPNLSQPGAMILLSPTLDWGGTHDGKATSSMTVNARSDIVGAVMQSGYSARGLVGSLPLGELKANAWFSPSSLETDTKGHYKGFPPVCIVAGGAEQTLDAMKTMRDRLEVDGGKEAVRYLEYEDAVHDFIGLPFHESEKAQALSDIHKWLKSTSQVVV